VNGIDNALTQVEADQASEVRKCLKPVRDRVLNVLLPDESKHDTITLTRDFLAGHWVVDQTIGPFSGGTTVDYRADGTFAGYYILFNGATGRKVPTKGHWDFTPQSNDTFQLTLTYDTPQPEVWTRTIRVIDHDHLQNTDDNYVASRM